MPANDFYLVRIKSITGYDHFIPSGASDAEKMKHIPYGKPLYFKYKDVRNLEHHQKFFAILRMVADNTDDPDLAELRGHFKIDLLLTKVKYAIGHITIFTLNGDIKTSAKSVSFAEMSQKAFEKFYSAAIPWLSEYSGISIEDMDANYYEYL